jgi:hypothetical protein
LIVVLSNVKYSSSQPNHEVILNTECDMYSFHEIRKIFARCKDYLELEKAAQAFIGHRRWRYE